MKYILKLFFYILYKIILILSFFFVQLILNPLILLWNFNYKKCWSISKTIECLKEYDFPSYDEFIESLKRF